ncbi:MFS domain-containing protein [Mycena kentingensis (nom. inval.)]|nr:MFS domain-containing protein [Mycena kentingensis (nom. inval.)]
MLPLLLLALLLVGVSASPLLPGPTPAPARVRAPDAQPTVFAPRDISDDIDGAIHDALSFLGSDVPSYVASGVPNFFQDLPTGDAVKSKLGLSDDQVAALPTQVLNIPSYANWTNNGWSLLVHGNVYKQPEIAQDELDDLANVFLIDTSVSELPENEAKNARNLTAEIFVLQQGDVNVTLSLDGVQTETIGPTTDQGDFATQVLLAEAVKHLDAGNETSEIQTIDVHVQGTDSGNSTGYLVPPTGFTVISDIDDILRVTKIYRPKEGLLNSFARDFTPWMNMPEIYASWAEKAPDLHFHYLTTTPEQATRVYMHFIYQTYPMGSFDTRPLNFSDVSATLAIRKFLLQRVFETFPQRKFILVADTTNSDVMKDYPEMATTYPGQVHCILLRNTSATDDGNHFPYDTSGFKDLNQSQYMFFTVPDDLKDMDITKGCYNDAVKQNVSFGYQGLPFHLGGGDVVLPPRLFCPSAATTARLARACSVSPLLIPMLLPLFCVLAVASTVLASVALTYPIDNQRPLIARVDLPYTWSLSPSTFTSAGTLNYTTSPLPDWVLFNATSQSFHGVPGAEDVGNLRVTVIARDSTGSASSTFTICITSFPAPEVNIPLARQFDTSNPAMSSVFPVAPNSALAASVPTLRIPLAWSFSIGLRYDTLAGSQEVFYAVQQANGSALPDWCKFRPDTLTINGVVPRGLLEPYILHLVLIGSDQEGYSAVELPFDIVAATHELVQLEALPTINVTSGGPFSAGVSCPDDFAGIVADEQRIEPANIDLLEIDTSSLNWLEFNSETRMLSGNPPDAYARKTYTLPLTVSAFNQSLHTSCTIAIVPSFFSTSTIPTQILADNRVVDFNLAEYFSNSTGDPSAGINLSAAFDTPEGNCLSFDSRTTRLSGSVPTDVSVSEFHITFTAFSNLTRSTSKTLFTLSIPPITKTTNNAYKHPSNLSAAAHRRLTLALAIVFGILGSVCAFGLFISAFRRCAKVEDTAKTEQNAWSESDKRWYGLVDEEKGYGASLPRSAMELENPFGPGAQLVTPTRSAPSYGNLGLGLRRVPERSGSNSVTDNGSTQSPGFMRKAEFLKHVRDKVRKVSEKYGSKRKTSSERPVISKPTLIVPEPEGLPSSTSNPFEDMHGIASYPGSAVLTASPSTSTGDHSIPRRRADFAPPRAPAAALVRDGLLRQPSDASITSEEEAVVQVASKATSIRSEMSHVARRPRLVPFTSATRVPVPQTPSPLSEPAGSPKRRVQSQKAVVMKEPARSPTADELSVGIQYVQALGADSAEASTPTVSSHIRTSFSSLESSHHGHTNPGSGIRTLVRAGERFRFRAAVTMYSAASYRNLRKLEAKLLSGKALPRFLHVDLNASKHSGAVEFYGSPGPRDLGEYSVGIYTIDDGACVGRVVVEVVGAGR